MKIRSHLQIFALLFLFLPLSAVRAAEIEELIDRIKKPADPFPGIYEEDQTVKEIQAVGPKAIPYLLPLLRDPNSVVRGLAATALGGIDGLTGQHLDAIIGSYRPGDRSLPPVIARIGTPKAADFLVGRLIRERPVNPELMHDVETLGEKAIRGLLQVYETEKRWDQQSEQMLEWVFEDLGSKAAGAVDPLLKIVNDDQAPADHRARAMKAVGAIGIPPERILPELQKRQKDKNPKIREAADAAIVLTRTPAGAPIMGQWLATSDNQRRIELLRDIAALRGEGKLAGPYVTPYLTSKDWEVRLEAINALGCIGYAAATDQLIALLDCPDDFRVPWRAARALLQLEAKSAVPALTRISQNHWYPGSREAAKEALTAIRDGLPPEPKNPVGDFEGYSKVSSTEEMLTQDDWARIKFPLVAVEKQIPPAALTAKRKGSQCGLKVDDGYLVGRYQGEWGGEITFFPSKGKSRIVLEDNCIALYRTPNGIFAITPVGSNEGRVCKLSKDAHGRWVAEPWRMLPGWPMASWLLEDGRFLIGCEGGITTITPDGQMKLLTGEECLQPAPHAP